MSSQNVEVNKKNYSIVICTFNRPQTCIRTISNIIDQKLDESLSYEIVVVDDNSDDQNSLILREYIKNKDIKYIKHSKNYGLSKARNTGIKNCNGKWFTFCDDDDYWPEGFFLKIHKTIKESNDEIGIVLGLSKKYRYSYYSLIKKNNKLSNLILCGITPPVAAQFFKKDLVDSLGGYNESVKSGVDHDLWISMAEEINPNVEISWGAEPKVSKEINPLRMTLNKIKRKKGIADSLIIWKEKIVKIFGINFYNHFSDSYKTYIEFNFLVYSFPNIKISSILKLLTNKYYLFYSKKIFFKFLNFYICNNFRKFKK